MDDALMRDVGARMKDAMDAEMDRAFLGPAPSSAGSPLTLARLQQAIDDIHGTPKVVITKDLPALLSAFGAQGWTAQPIRGEAGYRLRPPAGGRSVTVYESEFIDVPDDTVCVINLTEPRLV